MMTTEAPARKRSKKKRARHISVTYLGAPKEPAVITSTGDIVATEVPTTETSPPVAPRKIAIIGKAPSSVALAPYGDPTWEVWILNTLGHANEVPRWDRQFELHALALTKVKEYGDYYQWLTRQTRPVFLRDTPPEEFKNGVQFPLGEILKHFEHLAGKNYLTNTVSLMIALAIFEHEQGEKISEMGLWGVDMAQHAVTGSGNGAWFASEYARQRPSVEYWIGIAEGNGIKFTIPQQSDILKTACIYGYHTTDQQKKFMARRQELSQRIGQAQAVEQQKHDEAIFLAGALEGMNYDEQWLGGR